MHSPSADCCSHPWHLNGGAYESWVALCPFLCADNKHVVFGRVVDGMLTVRKLEAVQTGQNNRPKLPCVVTQCGEM